MKKNTIVVLCILITLAFSFYLGRITDKPEYITNTIIKTDTIYIETEPVIRWKTAFIERTVFDTLIIVNNDTIILKDTVQVASDEIDFKEGHLDTWYYFPPINKFKYSWAPVPQAVIYQKETITVVKKVKWYKSHYLWGAVGLGLGLYAGGN